MYGAPNGKDSQSPTIWTNTEPITSRNSTTCEMTATVTNRHSLLLNIGAQLEHILLAGHLELVGEAEVLHL